MPKNPQTEFIGDYRLNPPDLPDEGDFDEEEDENFPDDDEILDEEDEDFGDDEEPDFIPSDEDEE